MASLRVLALGIALSFASLALSASYGLVDHNNGENHALLVGVSHGLNGIDIDLKNVHTMVSNPAYRFEDTELMDEQGTVQGIADHLTSGAQATGPEGTFLFYFSGHGNVGLIWPEDDTMQISQIRDAVKAGRTDAGPLDRLVMIFDSCYSGSLLDPLHAPLSYGQVPSAKDELQANRAFVDAVTRVMTQATYGDDPYWKELMVIASSRADETSRASDDGSIFTLAMKRSFDETMSENGTVGDFITKAQHYTEGHHPVARLVPESLANEKMDP